MDIRTYFVADSTVSGVVYLTCWRKFSHRFSKGMVLMVCYSKMREQIRIFVLQPMRYFLDVNFRWEWMDKYGPSFCHFIPLNLHQILSSYGGKNAGNIFQLCAELSVRFYDYAATFTLAMFKNV